MRCKVCGQDNPPEAGFCANCGAALGSAAEQPSSTASVRCNSCGRYNPPEADFCSNCGTPLTTTVVPPQPKAVTKPFTWQLKWILVGGLAILIMFQIVYSFTLLVKPSPLPPAPTPVPPPPTPSPALEETTPVIIKGEALFFEDFEGGGQNWDLAEGWHLEEIGDNTVLKGRGHSWAVLQGRVWDNYAFEARFKPVKGYIHFNYRRTTSAGHSRYFIVVSRGGISLEKEIGDNFYDITDTPLQLDEGWHEMEIIGYGNAIRVYVDDTLLIFYKDDSPILNGGIAFETLEDSEFLIDGVKITETTGLAATTPASAKAEAVTFSDENLEAAVRDALGKLPDEEITTIELAELTKLSADESSITDLSGLEYCTNLTGLNLEKNQISDITLLENLTSLNVLQLDRNQISDMSPIEDLTSLNELELGDNQISDITPLENLTSLTRLSLNRNQIIAISPLVENTGLGEGDEVWLEDNNLDLEEGSKDMEHIRALMDRGVEVNY